MDDAVRVLHAMLGMAHLGLLDYFSSVLTGGLVQQAEVAVV